MPSVAQYREGNYGDTAGGTMAQVHTEVSACGTSPHVRQDCAVWGGIQSAISALVERILWPGLEVTERSVDVHVAAIRRKLGPYRDLVETLRGVGYRFKAA